MPCYPENRMPPMLVVFVDARFANRSMTSGHYFNFRAIDFTPPRATFVGVVGTLTFAEGRFPCVS